MIPAQRPRRRARLRFVSGKADDGLKLLKAKIPFAVYRDIYHFTLCIHFYFLLLKRLFTHARVQTLSLLAESDG